MTSNFNHTLTLPSRLHARGNPPGNKVGFSIGAEMSTRFRGAQGRRLESPLLPSSRITTRDGCHDTSNTVETSFWLSVPTHEVKGYELSSGLLMNSSRALR